MLPHPQPPRTSAPISPACTDVRPSHTNKRIDAIPILLLLYTSRDCQGCSFMLMIGDIKAWWAIVLRRQVPYFDKAPPPSTPPPFPQPLPLEVSFFRVSRPEEVEFRPKMFVRKSTPPSSSVVVSTDRSSSIYQFTVIYGLGVSGPTTVVLVPLNLPKISANQYP